MKGLDDFERMVMASLSPSGALILPVPSASDSFAEPPIDAGETGGLLPLCLGVLSVILLTTLAAAA